MRIPLRHRFLAFAIALSALPCPAADFADIPTDPLPGDEMLDRYFALETRRVAARDLAGVETSEDWERLQPQLRRQLFEMLGLQPLPARTPLEPEVTGTVERDGIVVEKILFQSRPGLYVTANFYRPAEQDGPLPAILYVCGHGKVNIDGVSYGNKTHYQHHGTWFAKNGYVCLTIDTLQLGEIEGIHHGTHRFGRWWWNSRSYTPAGVEAWNGIRALDYLETRSEVDPERIGVTGRSGGGAYSWYIAALDERIAAAAPVAGIANMRNHIVDGCIEGHCDCMFMVNTYRWDFASLASLVAPRPLLIGNTDDDRIFPLDGVVDVFQKTREIYRLAGAGKDDIGLALYQGGHKDTQPLRVSVFHWFERHLKGGGMDDELPDTTALPKLFTPQELKVLDDAPGNERNTVIDDYFTRRSPRTPKLPEDATDWAAWSNLARTRLLQKSFRGWPGGRTPVEVSVDFQTESEGVLYSKLSFQSQEGVRLPLFLVHRAGLEPEELDLVVLNVLGEKDWTDFLSSVGREFAPAFPGLELPEPDGEALAAELDMHEKRKWGMAYLPPRGIGPTAWTSDEKERTHIRRRFALLGQTLDGMRIWDIRRSLRALRDIEGLRGEEAPQFWLQASGTMAGNALYASLFEEGIHRLNLHDLPASHREGPELLNVLRFQDMPQAVAMAAERSQVRLYTEDRKPWQYVNDLSKMLEWPEERFQMRKIEGGKDAESGE